MRFRPCNGAPLRLNPPNCGLVAQLDRALDYESKGRAFESLRVHHEFQGLGWEQPGRLLLRATTAHDLGPNRVERIFRARIWCSAETLSNFFAGWQLANREKLGHSGQIAARSAVL